MQIDFKVQWPAAGTLTGSILTNIFLTHASEHMWCQCKAKHLDKILVPENNSKDGGKCVIGTVSRDYVLQVSSRIIFPQASENNIRVISNLSKIRGDIRKARFTTGINDTSVVHLEMRISPRSFEKIETALMGYSESWKKLIHGKNLKSKISWHCSFNKFVIKCV